MNLILRNLQNGEQHSVFIEADVRRWLPSAEPITLDLKAIVPNGLPAGDYELLLHLPDAVPSLANRSDYAIRFANQDTWEAATGHNRLRHKLYIASNQ